MGGWKTNRLVGWTRQNYCFKKSFIIRLDMLVVRLSFCRHFQRTQRVLLFLSFHSNFRYKTIFLLSNHIYIIHIVWFFVASNVSAANEAYDFFLNRLLTVFRTDSIKPALCNRFVSSSKYSNTSEYHIETRTKERKRRKKGIAEADLNKNLSNTLPRLPSVGYSISQAALAFPQQHLI